MTTNTRKHTSPTNAVPLAKRRSVFKEPTLRSRYPLEMVSKVLQFLPILWFSDPVQCVIQFHLDVPRPLKTCLALSKVLSAHSTLPNFALSTYPFTKIVDHYLLGSGMYVQRYMMHNPNPETQHAILKWAAQEGVVEVMNQLLLQDKRSFDSCNSSRSCRASGSRWR